MTEGSLDFKKILTGFTPKLRLLLEDKDFIIKTASDSMELKESMKLRHKVYYEELLTAGTESGLDFDRYDSLCDHLLVIEKSTSTLAGSYRLNVSPENDFYSSKEFDLTNILKLPGKKVELGRACVHPDYRRGKTAGLLVKGFLTYVSMADIRYLFGCSSITAEIDDLLQIWNLIIRHYRLPEDMDTPPVERQDSVLEGYKGLEKYPFDYKKARALLPPLIVLYLKTGSLVSSFPFYDKQFNCFDFFTLLDMERADRKIIKKLICSGKKTSGYA
jgi:putative hemolysin